MTPRKAICRKPAKIMHAARPMSFPLPYFSRMESSRYREIHTSRINKGSGPVKLLEAASAGQRAAKKQAAEKERSSFLLKITSLPSERTQDSQDRESRRLTKLLPYMLHMDFSKPHKWETSTRL